jgi:hypothetical protein
MADRYLSIKEATFDGSPLPLPVSLRMGRFADPQPAIGDSDVYATSIQLGPFRLTAELVIRDTSAAEALCLGQKGDLACTIGAADSGSDGRDVALAGAVLVAIELSYQQSAMATATLRFAAEADDGTEDPFSAEDSS